MPALDQRREPRLVQREPRRLAFLAIGCHPQPVEIATDRFDEPLLAPCRIGVVDPQQEASALRPREHPVVQRRADVADVQPAGGRGGETGYDGHALRCTKRRAPRQTPSPLSPLKHRD
jgi:hypothetical protein